MTSTSNNKVNEPFEELCNRVNEPFEELYNLLNCYCPTLNLNFEFMASPKPSDPPPYLNLQMVLVLCRDLEDTMDGCGSMGDVGKTFSDTIALGSGGPTSYPLDGG